MNRIKREVVYPEMAGLGLGCFSLTKYQCTAMTILMPTLIASVPAEPTRWRIARPAKPPRNRLLAKMILWSRLTNFFLMLKRSGSETSSTQTVVSTTIRFNHRSVSMSSQVFGNALEVPNCVFSLFAKIPCTPRLALMKPRVTNERVFVQPGSSRVPAKLSDFDFQMQMAAAMLSRAWRKVPEINQMRL